jgi:S-adenosylmethionine:tRNA ribosyltransferase-isomerase
MRVADFHFDLPEELIAQHPPAVRGSSRMLVVQRHPAPQAPTLADAAFTDLPSYLQPGDLLVLNDSRVLPSRLFAVRSGATTQPKSPAPSGKVEVLLTEQLSSDQAAAATGDTEANVWLALCRPAKKVVAGERLLFFDPAAPPDAPPVLTAEVVSVGSFGERTLHFAPLAPDKPDFFAAVSRIGHMPLPPYIHRDQAHASPDSQAEAEDKARYQTIYAKDASITPPGSAAAPTAGLHFTPEVLAALRERGVEIASVTLHVGLGTFQPVRVEKLADIRLHAERYTLPPATAEALNRALAEGRRVVAVGTTTTRTLEHIAQTAGAIAIQPHSGTTSIFLSPGHGFRIVSGLLTNFHLPESTLIMLVAALTGNTPVASAEPASKRPRFETTEPDLGRRQILAAYAHAVEQHYRFFSYGDCMLLL